MKRAKNNQKSSAPAEGAAANLEEKLKNFTPQEGHRFPITRRELLAAGLIQGAAAIAFPTLTSLLRPKVAKAADASAPAYFEVWASGGAVFPANVAITDASRNTFSNYANCGQGNGANITSKLSDGVTPIFANSVPMFTDSGFFQSLNGAPGMAPILAKTFMLSVPANLLSDSGSNIMSAQGLVQASVAPGLFIPYLQNTPQFSPSAYLIPPSPLAITDYSSLLDAVTARAGDTFSSLPAATRATITKFIQKMSVSQAQRFNSRPGGADFLTAVTAATDKVHQLSSGAVDIASFDPRLDATVAGIWGIAGQPNSSGDVVEAAITYNVAKGNAVSASLKRGGYDYHGADRGSTRAADKSVFDLVTKILRTLAYLGKPGLIQLTTDGSCYGTGPDAPFPGDSNNICCSHILIYSPNPLNMATRSGGKYETQIGQFTAGVIADQGPASSGERGVALATYLNYMALAGLSAKAPSFITGAGLSPAQITEMTILKS
jgi:hypothetical protein